MTMRVLSLLVILASMSIGQAAESAADSTRRPNIVFILADDMGYGDLGCYGRKDVSTPAIDGLARQGVRFTAHYSNGTECTPTRAAFLTGMYPQRIGGLECAIGTGDIGRYDEAKRLSDAHDLGLPAECVTLAELLKEQGYVTCLSGKWHLGYQPKFSPLRQGFDHALYCVGGGMDYFQYVDTLGANNLLVNGEAIPQQGYFTHLVTNDAVRFIQENQERPFFLYAAYTAPHFPYQGPNDYSPDPLPLDSPLWKQNDAPPEVYIEMMNALDRGVAAILKTLDQLELSDNTLVIFASDNGGSGSARNAPCSGIKGETREGGIRVPAMARWPGKIPAGIENATPCMTFDLSLSIARAAGVPHERTAYFDGIDILSQVAENAPPSERQLFWRRPRGENIWHACRDGQWKYVAEQNGTERSEYLFDVVADIGETRDLKSEHPDQFERLKSSYLNWEHTVRQGIRGKKE